MIDIPSQLEAIQREVGKRPVNGGNVIGVLLGRSYPAPVEDLWEATDPDRIKRLVETRLSPDGDSNTVLELEHTVPIEMAGSTAGALYVGPGWDGALLALDLFIRGEVAVDPVAAAHSPEALAFSEQSVHAWTAAVESSGTATTDEIKAATEVSLAQFAPDPNRPTT